MAFRYCRAGAAAPWPGRRSAKRLSWISPGICAVCGASTPRRAGVDVEPGLILGTLNAQLAPLDLMFGPDPASAERAGNRWRHRQ